MAVSGLCAMQKFVYRHHDPQNSPYYQCVEGHFETFELVYDARFKRQYGFFRPYVKRVIYRYLNCGILKNGFAKDAINQNLFATAGTQAQFQT